MAGIGGHRSKDVDVVAGRVGGDLPGPASQLPVEFVVDGVEEASLTRMVGLELLSFAHSAAGVVELGGEAVEAFGPLANLFS